MVLPELSIAAQSDSALLEAGRLRVEVSLRPFAFTIRRNGRRLLRAGGAWLAEGEIRDQFVQFTEGVIAHEERSPAQRARHAMLMRRTEQGVCLSFRLDGRAACRRGSRWRRARRASRLDLRRRRRAASPRHGLGPARRGAPRGPRPAPSRALRSGRPRHPARRRPPLHRARLPRRDAGRGRRAPGRLCPRPVDAVGPRLRGPVPHRRQRDALRPGGGEDLGLHPGPRRAPRARRVLRRDAGGEPARSVPRHRLPRPAAGMGLRILEEPRHPRAPGRRARRLRGLSPPRDPARRGRHRQPVGDPVQHLEVQPPPVSRRPRDDRPDAGWRSADGGVGDAMGEPRLARRPDPSATRLRAAARAARSQLRAGGGSGPFRHRAAG